VEAERDFLMKQVEDAYLATIYTLAAAINARDNYTLRTLGDGHSLCFNLGRGLGTVGGTKEDHPSCRYAARYRQDRCSGVYFK